MIGLILELIFKLGGILLLLFILQKLKVFKFLSTFFNFLNNENKKNFQNKERFLKIKRQLNRSIKKCDEL